MKAAVLACLSALSCLAQTPGWVRDQIVYECNPRTFSSAGNFQGITQRLGELHDLGITVLWLMPVHPAGQVKKKGTLGSPYAVRDYYAIEPSYGTAVDLKNLVRQAHSLGLKVIIDIVANHTAWDSVMMQWPDYYKKNAKGEIIPPVADWQDVAGLDYSNPRLSRYMTDMLAWWLKEFDLDGFRCDVAGMVPASFWDAARPELEKIKPGLFLLAEWNGPELMHGAFDVDYAWPFHATLTQVLQDGKPAAELRAVWEKERTRFPAGAVHLMFSDNHDEKRAIARFGEKGALAASALVFTLDGVPLLYNGMEVGDTTESGAPALFEKLPVFWTISERRPEFRAFYQKLIGWRKQYPALRRGDVVWLDNTETDRVVTYLRRTADEEILVAINLSNRPYTGRVDGIASAGFQEITAAKAPGLPALTLEAWGFKMYRRSLR